MPDIFTHIVVGISAGLLTQKKTDRCSILLITTGSILPDIERPISWLLLSVGADEIGLTQGFHSILGAILLSFFAASMFELADTTRIQRFILIFFGIVTHLLLDMTMYPWAEQGLFLLFPIRLPFSFNLFWPDYQLYPLIGLIIFGFTLAVVYIRDNIPRHTIVKESMSLIP